MAFSQIWVAREPLNPRRKVGSVQGQALREFRNWPGAIRKLANPFGLHDMHGNVWEWCEDWYDANYYGKSPPEDPKGPPAGSSRVVRGGGWGRNAVYCRAADRLEVPPANRFNRFGFRVVRISE